MKEIKFRVWYNTEDKMEYTTDYIKEKYWPNDYIMQYSWLKDKNGKEIYEGDTVRILYTDWASKSQDDTRELEQYLIDISHKSEVVFMRDRYWLKCWEKYDSIFPWTHWFIEVIWNIYENKNLIF